MNVLRALYRGDNDFDIVGKFRVGLALSGILLVLSVGSLFVRGLNLGIDFEGGTLLLVPTEASVSETRDALRPLGHANAKIQFFGTGDSRTVRVQVPPLVGEEADVERDELRAGLADFAGVEPQDVSVSEVGPSWGDEISRKAQRALVFFLIAIALYITLRFEWKMAAAGLAAVFHDVIATVGIYSLFQFEVTPATVIAFLTILGYSLYDTIVVFDKINENAAIMGSAGRSSYGEIVNLSMNEVMMRSINTTITSVLPVSSMLVVGSVLLGAATLQEFALALMIGLALGAYSSIFVASPALVALKEREPRYAARAQRAAAVRAGAATGDDTAGRPWGAGLGPDPVIEPRGRKKRKR